MTTAADIILLALKDIKLVDENETPSSAALADAFTTLKQMLYLWQVDGLSIFATQDVTFAPTGALSYTVGTGGTIASIARPDDIKYCYYANGGVSYPMLDKMTTREEYESIALKALQTIPYTFYYEPSYPLGTLFLYPQPNDGTMHFGVDVDFTDYTAPANDLALPSEYAITIRANLALLLGDMFGTGVSPMALALATNTKRTLDRNNLRIPRNLQNKFVSKDARFRAGGVI